MSDDTPLEPPSPDAALIERAARLHLSNTLATRANAAARDEAGAQPAIAASRIVAYATGAVSEDDAVAAAIRSDLSLRRLYLAAVEQAAVTREVQQLAAADVDAPDRLALGQAFVYWRPLDAEGERMIVLVELLPELPARAGQTPMLSMEWDDHLERVNFGGLVDGVAQCVLRADDLRLQRMRADAGRSDPVARYALVLRP